MIKILWLTPALIFGFMNIYSAYYVDPEAALVYILGMLALSFPLGLAVAAIVPLVLSFFGVERFYMREDIFMNIMIVAAGYYQWFVLFPRIRNKMK